MPRFRLILPIIAALFAPVAQADFADACNNFLQAQDYPRALEESASRLKAKKLSRENEYSAHLCRGRALNNLGQPKAALPEFKRVEALSRSQEELLLAYNWLGSTYSDLRDLSNTELYYNRELQIAHALGYKKSEATALNNLATVYGKKGDPDKALAFYQMSLDIRENESDKVATYINIAGIYSDRGDHAKAIETLLKTVEITRRTGDYHRQAIVQIHLGSIYVIKGEYAKAEESLIAGLEGAKNLGDRANEAGGCIALAGAHLARRNPVEARKYLERGEKYYRDNGNAAEIQEIEKAFRIISNLEAKK